jgi:hypothetical protein
MIGHCMIYLQQNAEAVAIIADARKLALRAQNPHTAMFAAQSLGVVLTQSGQPDEALQHLPGGPEEARALGARRYESNLLSDSRRMFSLARPTGQGVASCA